MKRRSIGAIIVATLLATSMIIPVMADEIADEIIIDDVEVCQEEATEDGLAEEILDVAEVVEEPAIEDGAIFDEVVDAQIEEVDINSVATEDGASIVSQMTLEFSKSYDLNNIEETAKFYKIKVPSSGIVTVKGHTNSVKYSWNSITYAITDGAGKSLGEQAAGAGKDCIFNVNLLAGDYYLCLHTDGVVVTGDATARLEFEAVEETVADTILEPHNSILDAIKYTGGVFKGFLARNDHKDVFEYVATEDTNINIKYASQDMGNIMISVMNSSGDEVYNSELPFGVGTHSITQFVNKGKCYIAVYVEEGYSNHPGGTYQLTITGQKANDEWTKTSRGWKCKLRTGEQCYEGLYLINGKYYYFINEIMCTGWIEVDESMGSTYYYFESSGEMAKSKWIGNYYVESDGRMAKDKWVDGGKYYVDGNGKWVPGKTQGSSSSSSVKAGWKKDGKGWWYQNSNGSYPKACWAKIDGSWYHFNGSGYMQTGWIKDGGKWYYLKSSGAMATGWLKDGGKWYYLSPSGSMATGWINVGGKDYYMYGDGHMAANEWIGKYHVNSSGAWDKTR